MEIVFSNAPIPNTATHPFGVLIFEPKSELKKPRLEVYIDILESLGFFVATAF